MPEEVRIEALMRRGTPHPDAEIQTVPGPEGAAQMLYADPALPEPWADRAVVVGRVAGSDVEGGFGGGDGTTAATIQGTQGRETLKTRRRGRPLLGSGPAEVVPVRLDPELKSAIEARAATEQLTTSELIRRALRHYLDVA